MATVETATAFPAYRLTVDRYERMAEAGVFSPREPVFLWRGGLVERLPEGCPHAFAVGSLMQILMRLESDGWHARAAQPMAVGVDSMPEPDIAIVRGSPRDYVRKHPSAEDAGLIVEVADSSLAADLGEKLAAYATRGVPAYWVVNIPGRRVEVFSMPDGAGYGQQRSFGPGERVPVAIDGRPVGEVAVADLLE